MELKFPPNHQPLENNSLQAAKIKKIMQVYIPRKDNTNFLDLFQSTTCFQSQLDTGRWNVLTPQKISDVSWQNLQTSLGENEDGTPRLLSKGLPKRKEPNTIRLMLTCI